MRTEYRAQYRSIEAALAPSNNTNDGRVHERDATEGEEATIKKKYHAPEGEVVKSERCDTDDINTNLMPAESKNIDAHKPRESRDLDVDGDAVDTRAHAVKRIVGHMQKSCRTHYDLQRYGYKSRDNTVEPPEHLSDHFIDKY